MTEHWKTLSELETIGLENFTLGACFCREHNEHGGSAVYVHKSVEFKSRNKLNRLAIKNEFECAAE